MSDIHPSFHRPPPREWAPHVGQRVRLLYQDKTYEGVITQVLNGPGGYVVSSDDLLLPVVCGRDSLRPMSGS